MAQSITVAADLRIADALAEKPLGIDELASRVECDPDALGRLLRALIGRGIFKQLRDGRYDLTPLARTLRWDAPDSMAALASFIGSPQDREHWSHCVDAIRTGESVIPKLRGMEGFEWFASEPELSEVFNQAMTNFSELAADPVTAAYDFSGTTRSSTSAVGTAACWPASSRPPRRRRESSSTCRKSWRAPDRCCGNTMSPIVSASPKGRSSIRPPRAVTCT